MEGMAIRFYKGWLLEYDASVEIDLMCRSCLRIWKEGIIGSMDWCSELIIWCFFALLEFKSS